MFAHGFGLAIDRAWREPGITYPFQCRVIEPHVATGADEGC